MFLFLTVAAAGLSLGEKQGGVGVKCKCSPGCLPYIFFLKLFFGSLIPSVKKECDFYADVVMCGFQYFKLFPLY